MAQAKHPTMAKSPKDALQLLTADHEKVKKLFKQFDTQSKSASNDDKKQLVEQICLELAIHAQIEEEIFYPAARNAIDKDDLMDEAIVEHASIKELISQLELMAPNDDLFDAKVTVLREYVLHHATEEENEMFPKVKKSKLDIKALGAELQERKQELKNDEGLLLTTKAKGSRATSSQMHHTSR